MTTGKKIRLFLLATTFSSILVVLGKSIFYPQTQNTSVAPFTFPETVPLPNWDLATSNSANIQLAKQPADISGETIAQKHYRYIQNGVSLDIEMRYLVNTNANLKGFIANRTGQLSLALREKKQIGFYSLFLHQGKAHLISCINPRGRSTVTTDQFKRNGYVSDLRWDRIAIWLTSSAEFRDKRCLWTHLSVPLKNTSAEKAYQTLETAWFTWYDWWRRHFPKSEGQKTLVTN